MMWLEEEIFGSEETQLTQLFNPIWTHDPDQGYTATQQGCVKFRPHITVPAVPTQEAIPEEGG